MNAPITREQAKAVLQELHRRAALVNPPYIQDLHPKQKRLFYDKSRWKAAHPGRRGGKTTVAIRAIAHCMNLHPNSDTAYLALTLDNAKNLAWKPMQDLNRQYGWGWKFNKVERIAYAPNGSRWFLLAGNKEEDIDKARGFAYRRVVIDEAASFRAHLRKLIEEVFEPALGDHRGDIWLIGSPGATCAGYFYNACKNKEGFERWSVHHWDVRDNTYFNDPVGWLASILRQYGWTETHPIFQREYLGKWFTDPSGLVYPYDSKWNVPALPRPANEWFYVLALDFGVVDACAFVVLAYHPRERAVYIVKAFKHAGLAPSDFVTHVRKLQRAFYQLRFGRPPIDEDAAENAFESIVGDTVGTGKPFCQELVVRTGLYVKPAEKSSKLAFIQHMGGDINHGHVRLIEGECEELEHEWGELPWEDDDHTKYNDRKHDDHLADASLYGWRDCRPYEMVEADEDEPDPGTPEWYNRQAAREELEEALAAESRATEWEEAYGYPLEDEF